MAGTTYYALPALTSWGGSGTTVGGLSNTSGGPAIASSVNPTAYDTVIFDANSGPGRTLGINSAVCAALSVTSTAGGFNFNGTVNIGTSVVLNAASTILSMVSTSTTSIKCNGGYIADISFGPGTVSLLGVGNFGSINTGAQTFDTNGFDFSCTSIVTANSTAGYPWLFYTNTVTLNITTTGAQTVYPFNRYSGAAISGNNLVINFTSDNASARANIGALGSITNVTVKTIGPGSVVLPTAVNLSKFTLRGNVLLQAGSNFTTQTIFIDGNGAPGGIAKIGCVVVGGSPATVNRTSNTVSYFDRMQATDIAFVPSGGPIHSRSDQGSIRSTGFDTVPGNTKFLQFF